MDVIAGHRRATPGPSGSGSRPHQLQCQPPVRREQARAAPHRVDPGSGRRARARIAAGSASIRRVGQLWATLMMRTSPVTAPTGRSAKARPPGAAPIGGRHRVGVGGHHLLGAALTYSIRIARLLVTRRGVHRMDRARSATAGGAWAFPTAAPFDHPVVDLSPHTRQVRLAVRASQRQRDDRIAQPLRHRAILGPPCQVEVGPARDNSTTPETSCVPKPPPGPSYSRIGCPGSLKGYTGVKGATAPSEGTADS